MSPHTDLAQAIINAKEAERVATDAWRACDQVLMNLRVAQMGMMETSKHLRMAAQAVEDERVGLTRIVEERAPDADHTHEGRIAAITPRPGTYTKSVEGVLQAILALDGSCTKQELACLTGWSEGAAGSQIASAECAGAVVRDGHRPRRSQGRRPVVYRAGDGQRPVRDEPHTADPVATGAEPSDQDPDGVTVEVPQPHAGGAGSAPSAPEPSPAPIDVWTMEDHLERMQRGEAVAQPAASQNDDDGPAATPQPTAPADDIDFVPHGDGGDQYDGRSKRDLLEMCVARGISATKTDSLATIKQWLRREVSEDPGFSPGRQAVQIRAPKKAKESDEVVRQRLLEGEIVHCLTGERETVRGVAKQMVRNVHEIAGVMEDMRRRGILAKNGDRFALTAETVA